MDRLRVTVLSGLGVGLLPDGELELGEGRLRPEAPLPSLEASPAE